MEPRTNRKRLLEDVSMSMRKVGTEIIMLNQAVADALGINVNDYRCVTLIALHGRVSASRLAKLAGLSGGAITGVVDRLERMGYVKRVRSDKDRRSITIELANNDKTSKSLEAQYHPLAQKTERLASSYDDKELSLIIGFLLKEEGIFHEENKRFRSVNKEPKK